LWEFSQVNHWYLKLFCKYEREIDMKLLLYSKNSSWYDLSYKSWLISTLLLSHFPRTDLNSCSSKIFISSIPDRNIGCLRISLMTFFCYSRNLMFYTSVVKGILVKYVKIKSCFTIFPANSSIFLVSNFRF